MRAVRKLTILSAMVLLSARAGYAQDNKQGQDKPLTPEEVAREQIEKNYKAALAGQDIKVTLEVRNAKISDIVEEFRRQVRGINFDLDSRNIPEDYRIDEFIIRNEPWRSAFNAFILKAELSIDQESGTLIRISRPPRVTFAFKDADIKTVIDLIARMSGANIIMDTGAENGVKGTLTMSVNNVPWPNVLETVVKTMQYTTVREKYDIIRIVSPKELLKQIEHRLFKLTYITPPPPYIAKMEEGKYLKGVGLTPPSSFDDTQKQFMFLNLINGLLTRDASGGAIGRLDYDAVRNTLVVSDTKIALDEIERLIKVLDVEPGQVLIDVKYISTTNDDLLTFGTNYAFGADDGFQMTTHPVMPVRVDGAAPTPGSVFTTPIVENGLGKYTKLPFGLGSQSPAATGPQYFLTKFDMTVAFRAFKRDAFSKLLQEPTLAVMDNTEATIFVGEQVPYAESRAVSTTTGTIAYTIGEGARSPVKIGFQLMVIPKIIRETNRVLLTVIPSNEFLSGTSVAAGLVPGFERYTLAGAGQNGIDAVIDLPRTSNTTLVTRLIVESGRTAVLGGLKTERASYEDKKIPFLGDLPVIDFLFKRRNDSVHRESLIIFITPRIVKSSAMEEDLRIQVLERENAERKAIERMKRDKAAAEMKMADDKHKADAVSDLKNQ